MPGIDAPGQCSGQFERRLLCHAVEQVIGLGVEEYRGTDPVGPVVVMGHPSQAGLQPAEYDRLGAFEKSPDEVRIDERGPVGAAGVLAAGGVIVAFALLFERGVVGHH